ncbi:hypothetical protein MPC4_20297 [Methylocella tundrae]|uniref:Uncharacterized protein n=1 Tax=Methylocella tundrae TaxID=227605 RepID=A0A8B6M507_METTU|nr:hypothetical protein MPC1_1940003 [Methylocella tundrae]VTZ50087.1 hypothetical protein MPC4_20297 [Methylocella tundrae]
MKNAVDCKAIGVLPGSEEKSWPMLRRVRPANGEFGSLAIAVWSDPPLCAGLPARTSRF